jgi:hypothetical protein
MPFSKLLQLDTDSVTPARAAAVFLAEVNRLVREQGMDLSSAWKVVSTCEPDLYDRLKQDPQADGEANGEVLGNGALGAPALPAAPMARKAFIAPAFHLPLNVSDHVFDVAWQANGRQGVTVDSRKIFLALCTDLMKQKGVRVADARRELQENYPQLCRAAGQTLGVS